MKLTALIALLAILLASCGPGPPASSTDKPAQGSAAAPAPEAEAAPEVPPANPGDWAQWGGSSQRNNVVSASVATEWNIGEIDWDTGAWKPEDSENILWVAKLGSMSYGNPVIADGKVLVGTNNDSAYVEKHPKKVDLGCLIAFKESDGSFLWQHSNPKLATGDQHDWGQIGVSSAPLVVGKRAYYVNNRAEVVCLDSEGFHDEKNNGYDKEVDIDKTDADVIWAFDMMKELGTEQRNAANCSVTLIGDTLLVNTSNGADEESHIRKPKAPSFIALHKDSG
ncbi:MAG: hypothetical protein ACI8W8_004373, partial [Rhodothermales bacterium]